MNHSLRCECGQVQGVVQDAGHALNRSVCYCHDCRAYARWLGRTGAMLDAHGGTGIVAVRPRQIDFVQGRGQVVCLTLAEGGLLRWHASCCGAAIANTPRNFRLGIVNVVASCLAGDARALEAAFGPVQLRLNAQGASGTLPPLQQRKWPALWRTLSALVVGRLDGGFRCTPFFDPASGLPLPSPRVLTVAEREPLYV